MMYRKIIHSCIIRVFLRTQNWQPRVWLVASLVGTVLGVSAIGLRPFFAFATAPTDTSRFQPGELIVKLWDFGSVLRLRFTPDVSLPDVLREYRARPEVQYVELNYRVHATAFPNDPNYGKQWYLEAVQGRDTWSDILLDQEERQVKPSIIAVLDTGVDSDHPDLKSRIWTNVNERSGDRIDNDRNGFIDDVQGWDFVSNTSDPTPKFDPGYLAEAIHHGTIVAGIAAAASHNNIGITGVSWSSQIMPLRVLDAEGNGTVYNVLQAVEYAVAQRADVINLSFVGVDFSQALYDGLKSAAKLGVVVVAAAGNSSNGNPGRNLANEPAYPICLDAHDPENFIIGVAALNRQRQLTMFSNYGKGCVDIAAPGVDMYGLLVHDSSRSGFSQQYGGAWAGTSVATPIVSGAAALARSMRPGISVAAVREIVLRSFDDINTANPKYPGQLGSGQINLHKVVVQVLAYRGSGANMVAPTERFIVAGLGYRSFPQVKLFTPQKTVLKSFFAYASTFNGSVMVAAGDVTGDGVTDIVTGAGAGGGPHVRIFNREGHVLNQFFAYDQTKRFGVNVAVGNVDGSLPSEIITAPAAGGPPEVKVYSGSGETLGSWLAYDPNFSGGVHLAAGDIDGDGVDEIITGAGPGGNPQVRIFDAQGSLRSEFLAHDSAYRGGVRVNFFK